jgi:hypothetical protein
LADDCDDGVFASLWNKLKSLGSSSAPPSAEQKCKKKPAHWITIRLRYKDDKTDVPAADCLILLGDATKSPGPLAAGKLELKDIDAGSYVTTFEIDGREWDLE